MVSADLPSGFILNDEVVPDLVLSPETAEIPGFTLNETVPNAETVETDGFSLPPIVDHVESDSSRKRCQTFSCAGCVSFASHPRWDDPRGYSEGPKCEMVSNKTS